MVLIKHEHMSVVYQVDQAFIHSMGASHFEFNSRPTTSLNSSTETKQLISVFNLSWEGNC